MSIATHLEAIRRGRIDPRDVLAEFAEQIALLSPAESGFAHVDIDAAFRRLASAPAGRLHGLLLPIKDLMPVSGMPTSYGSVTRRAMHASDPYALALERAGAVIPGKTATSELGMSAYTEPVGMPAVSNPRLPGHTPGGSSGGAAVAVARGLVQVAHASDGGGSIRVPAAACGVVGFKPPHNSAGGTLTAQGFITRTVEDAAFMAGVTLSQPRRLRVGMLTVPLHLDGSVAPDMLAVAEETAGRLSDLGHSVVEVTPAYGPAPFQAFSDVLAGMCRRIEGPASPIVSYLRDTGLAMLAERRHAALEEFAAVPATVLRAWDIDVMLSPTLAYTPPQIGAFSALPPAEDFAEQTRWTPWCTLSNITGWAGISVPVERSESVHLSAIRCTPAELLGLASELAA